MIDFFKYTVNMEYIKILISGDYSEVWDGLYCTPHNSNLPLKPQYLFAPNKLELELATTRLLQVMYG